jgi:hypothetical protein
MVNPYDLPLRDWLLRSLPQIQLSDLGEILPHITQGCPLLADSGHMGPHDPLALRAGGHLFRAMFSVCFTRQGSVSIESLPKKHDSILHYLI